MNVPRRKLKFISEVKYAGCMNENVRLTAERNRWVSADVYVHN